MSAEDGERFEAVAGDLLEGLGYSRAIQHPGREAQKHASFIYEIFTQDARSRRGRPLPRYW